MVYDVFERSPEPPVFFSLMTEEEKIQYNNDLDAYLKAEKPKVTSKLKEMGFEIKSYRLHFMREMRKGNI